MSDSYICKIEVCGICCEDKIQQYISSDESGEPYFDFEKVAGTLYFNCKDYKTYGLHIYGTTPLYTNKVATLIGVGR